MEVNLGTNLSVIISPVKLSHWLIPKTLCVEFTQLGTLLETELLPSHVHGAYRTLPDREVGKVVPKHLGLNNFDIKIRVVGYNGTDGLESRLELVVNFRKADTVIRRLFGGDAVKLRVPNDETVWLDNVNLLADENTLGCVHAPSNLNKPRTVVQLELGRVRQITTDALSVIGKTGCFGIKNKYVRHLLYKRSCALSLDSSVPWNRMFPT